MQTKIRYLSGLVSVGVVAGIVIGTAISPASATVDPSYYVVKNSIAVVHGVTTNVDAVCNDGDTAVGGGSYLVSPTGADFASGNPYQVGLSQQATGWTAWGYNGDGSGSKSLIVYAVCKDT